MENRILNMDSVQDYNDNLGVDTLHPLVSVVDMSQLKEIRHSVKRFGFYCVFLKQLDCGSLMYGRSRYDYREGTMLFIAPGQIAGADDGGVSENPKGWILMFHPDLLKGTSLAARMR
ncbi:MAG: AraC family transcriptional regulator, partial [Bacteroidales bacterium]|nr:AraC family transcriptional regulator [Bacteroidales bacterium]